MPRRGDTKETLILALMRLVAQYGLEAATISAIAQEAGITQGAIYRHYRSKEELLWTAYKQTIQAMAQEKEQLMRSDFSLPDKLHRWIDLTYLYFDRDPDAFSYVLLTPHPQLKDWDRSGITTRQGELFMQLFEEARETKMFRDISPQLALSHFIGLMLNVPRLINEGVLEGPAVSFLDEVFNAIWQVLGPSEARGCSAEKL